MLDKSTVVHLKYRSDGTQISRELIQDPDMDRNAEKPRPRGRGFFGRSDRRAGGLQQVARHDDALDLVRALVDLGALPVIRP
ncbi:hypothetical protein ACIO87_22640 [Streptomyces sp. NPDC087218]|uniref:hypothetical protein n=1 Tax=Streptomyces sp. NPDC087218 TaxID=3365769 RepID=UPI00380958F3